MTGTSSVELKIVLASPIMVFMVVSSVRSMHRKELDRSTVLFVRYVVVRQNMGYLVKNLEDVRNI